MLNLFTFVHKGHVEFVHFCPHHAPRVCPRCCVYPKRTTLYLATSSEPLLVISSEPPRLSRELTAFKFEPGLDTVTVELTVKTLFTHLVTLERIRFSRQFFTGVSNVRVAPPSRPPLDPLQTPSNVRVTP
eukprot:1183521-Prorocentrum_minimum.AAC.1